MQFTELRGADYLVRFWLEAESFRATSWSRVRAHSLNSVKHSSLAEPVAASPDDTALPELTQYTPRPFSLCTHDGTSGSPTMQPEQQDSFSTEADLRPGTPRAETPTRQTSSGPGTPFKLQSNSTLKDLSDKLMKSESASKQQVCLFMRVVQNSGIGPTLLLYFWPTKFVLWCLHVECVESLRMPVPRNHLMGACNIFSPVLIWIPEGLCWYVNDMKMCHFTLSASQWRYTHPLTRKHTRAVTPWYANVYLQESRADTHTVFSVWGHTCVHAYHSCAALVRACVCWRW